MKTQTFGDFRKALESLIAEDGEYVLVRHVLKSGEKIKLHYHPNATEWLIFNRGIINIRVGKEKKSFNSSDILSLQEAVFLFPKGKIHAIEARTEIKYFVLRDKKDKTIYAKEE